MKYLRNSFLLLLLSFVAASGQSVSEAGSETYLKIREVGKQLKCQCESQCSYTVTECNMLHCSFRERMKPEIKNLVEAGIPVPAVVEQLVEKYGSILRTAPAASGFGLFGWAMPFVAVLLGLGAAPILAWRWKVKHDRRPVSKPVRDEDVERFRNQIEKDIEEME